MPVLSPHRSIYNPPRVKGKVSRWQLTSNVVRVGYGVTDENTGPRSECGGGRFEDITIVV